MQLANVIIIDAEFVEISHERIQIVEVWAEIAFSSRDNPGSLVFGYSWCVAAVVLLDNEHECFYASLRSGYLLKNRAVSTCKHLAPPHVVGFLIYQCSRYSEDNAFAVLTFVKSGHQSRSFSGGTATFQSHAKLTTPAI